MLFRSESKASPLILSHYYQSEGRSPSVHHADYSRVNITVLPRQGDRYDWFTLKCNLPSHLNQHELMTAKEELKLGRRVQKGCKKARTEFIKRNLKLVISLAGRYRGRCLAELVARSAADGGNATVCLGW